MACVEASNIRDFAVDLAPGEQHTMKTIIRVAAAPGDKSSYVRTLFSF